MGEHHPAASHANAEPDADSHTVAGCIAISERFARRVSCTDVCLPAAKREVVTERDRVTNAVAQSVTCS